MPKRYFKLYPSRASIWESLKHILQYQEKKIGIKTEVPNFANYTRITAEATQFEQNNTGLEFLVYLEFPTIPSELFSPKIDLSCFSPKIHLQDLWNRFQFVLDHNLTHFEANLFDRGEIVMEAVKNRRFSGTLECWTKDKKLVTKTPISQVLARMSLCWLPMSICGKNVDTLRACKRSNRIFFPYIYRKYLYIFSYPVYYVGSPKVPPRVFDPLGPKTLRGQ